MIPLVVKSVSLVLAPMPFLVELEPLVLASRVISTLELLLLVKSLEVELELLILALRVE